MRRRFGPRRGDERGSAMVEAALILPVILMLTFGAIEFGIGFSQKGGIEAISRSGARTGAAASADDNASGTPSYPVPHTEIAVEVAQAVNGALASSTLPELLRLYVYKVNASGVPTLPNAFGAACGVDCVMFNYDTATKKFDAASPIGSWPYAGPADTANRILCGVNADRIGVRIEGRFHFLTNIVGNGTVNLQAKSILQLEPNDC